MAARERNPNARQKFYFQFVTTPTSDTPGTTLLLHFDNRRYFFGHIAEGTQRACIQRGVGIKKVRNIFLTGQTKWNNMGGLIGMILTLADVQIDEKDETTGKRPRLHIHGGPKLQHAMACARRFVFRTGMPLSVYEAKTSGGNGLLQPQYSDENIDVWSLAVQRTSNGSRSPALRNDRSASPETVDREQALREKTVHDMFDSEWRKDRLVESQLGDVKLPAVVFVRDPETKGLSNYRVTSLEDVPHLTADHKVLVRNPWPAATVGELPPADNISGSVAMSYIIRGHPQRGTFILQKAKELGIKPGPIYAQLTAGMTVTLEDGKVITPDMVLTDPEPGKGMAVLDVPGTDYLEDLSSKLEDTQTKELLASIEMVCWILGPTVFYSAEFRRIVRSLPHVQHFMSSPDVNANYLALDSSAASSLRLSYIRPECFREPKHNNYVQQLPSNVSLPDEINFQPVERGLIVQCAPKILTNREEIPHVLNVQQTKQSCAKELSQLIPSATNTNDTTPYDDVEIVTLGTGSAVPSKYRNVSASLLRIPGLGSYLIDCGENTIGQLKRVYTPEELDEVLCDLRLIWISHLHADHHLGTLSVITARNEAISRRGFDSKLYIISEPNMGDFLCDFSSVQASDNCVLLSCVNSVMTLNGNPHPIEDTSLPIKTFATTLVSHCHGAQAVSITFFNGFKFSYSGDCRPSSNFAKIGLDSDLLLHEATFDDGMEGDAKAKKHCTTAEALGVAIQMQAKHVVLTHFSQRYQKIPVLNTIKFGEDIQFEEAIEQEGDETLPIETETAPGSSIDQSTARDSTVSNFQPFSASVNLQPSAMTSIPTDSKLHVAVAFDLMRVTLPQIRDMYKYYPAIERMFELEQERSDARKEIAALEQEKRKDINQGKSKKKRADNEVRNKANTAATTNGVQSVYDKINRGRNARVQSSTLIDRSRSRSTSASRNAGAIAHLDTQTTNSVAPSAAGQRRRRLPTPNNTGSRSRSSTSSLSDDGNLSNRARKKMVKKLEKKQRKSLERAAQSDTIGGSTEDAASEDKNPTAVNGSRSRVDDEEEESSDGVAKKKIKLDHQD